MGDPTPMFEMVDLEGDMVKLDDYEVQIYEPVMDDDESDHDGMYTYTG